MSNKKFENISIGLEKQFHSILQSVFEYQEDIPDYDIYIAYKNTNGEYPDSQYRLNNLGTLSVGNIDILSFHEYIPQENYYGTFYFNNFDAFYYYKCNDIEIYIAFVIEQTDFIEVIKTITKVYIESILKPLSKMIGHMDVDIKEVQYHLNADFDEESTISKVFTEFFWRLYDLDIHLISLLSSQKYESSELYGRIFIPHRGAFRSEKELAVKFLNKVKITNNIRQIRKLMEIASGKYGLVVGKNSEVIGYGISPKEYECEVQISGHLNWKVCMKTIQIIYSNGVFRISKKDNKIAIDIPKIFHLNDIQQKNLSNVLANARQQKHGTLLIIGEPMIAKKEAKRLCDFNRGIGIKPINLSKNLDIVGNITSIDGAIFMDTNCICYGIGVILDGEVITMGDPARGARFNSAVNYVENCKKQNETIIAIVISEDRTIDFCY